MSCFIPYFVTISLSVIVSSVLCFRIDDFVFSDQVNNILESVQGVVGNIQDFIGDNNGCAFTCSDGMSPVANVNHVPSSNGCGAFGIKFDSEVSVVAVTKCCDEHDLCYDTCNNKKKRCDRTFKTCLESVCKRAKKILSEDLYKGCKSAADVMYAGTVALGCKPYKDAQQKACVCRRRPYKTDL